MKFQIPINKSQTLGTGSFVICILCIVCNLEFVVCNLIFAWGFYVQGLCVHTG